MFDKKSLDFKVLVPLNVKVKRVFGCGRDNKIWIKMSDKSLLSKTEREKTQISGQTGVGWISTSKIQYLYVNEYRLNHLEI